MANASFYHNVPIMVQPMDWACWYTSYQMIVAYMRNRDRGGSLRDPSEVPWVQALYDRNRGVGTDDPEERGRVAAALGFEALYATLTGDGLLDILRRVPILYDGQWRGQNSGHAVVMVGMSGADLTINNPASGMESQNYDRFISQTLVQTRSRALIYPP